MLPHRAVAPPDANHPKPRPHAPNRHNQLQFSFSHSYLHLRRLSLSPVFKFAIRLPVNYWDSRTFLASPFISGKDQSKSSRHWHSALGAFHLQLNVFEQDACLSTNPASSS